MADIIVQDPKWLLNKFQHLINVTNSDNQSLVDLIKKYGILAQPLCERVRRSDDMEHLPKGLLELLKIRHLAAKINAYEVIKVMHILYHLSFPPERR